MNFNVLCNDTAQPAFSWRQIRFRTMNWHWWGRKRLWSVSRYSAETASNCALARIRTQEAYLSNKFANECGAIFDMANIFRDKFTCCHTPTSNPERSRTQFHPAEKSLKN